MQTPVNERDPDQRNRVIELYNGSDKTIDLGNDQYFLEIYAGSAIPAETSTIITPPLLLKKTISLQSDIVFEFDKADIKADASDDLKKVAAALNKVDFFSEILIAGHTCDLDSDEYNLALSERRADSVRDFLLPVPPTVHEVESKSAGSMAAGEYAEGDKSPRQVIGMNGAIEAGETWVIAFDQSDDAIKDKAHEVTGQLDFKSNETLVVRRMGGEMALNCRAQSYAYVTNFPAVPFVRYPDPSPAPPPEADDVASPN